MEALDKQTTLKEIKQNETTGQHDKGGTLRVSMKLFSRDFENIYIQYKECYTYIKWNVCVYTYVRNDK